MIDFNTYINGLDLSALKEHCVHLGRLTQYAKGDYFVKVGEESHYIAYVECGYFNYKVHNFSESKDGGTIELLSVPSCSSTLFILSLRVRLLLYLMV